MNRIDKTFKELKSKKKKAFISFITAGDPSLKQTESLVLALERAGTDIIELGLPFSDPLADGPTIQAASYRALNQGVTLDKIFSLVKSIRAKTEIPLVFMTYYNLIYHYGENKFIEKAKTSGVDGLIIPDLPPEEGADLIRIARKEDVATIFFIAPTTRVPRMKKIIKASTGFIYYVSLTGVTGARKQLPGNIASQIREIKAMTNKPICIGFGISNAEQVKKAARVSDGVIVGSAIVNMAHRYSGTKDALLKVSRFVKGLTKGLEKN